MSGLPLSPGTDANSELPPMLSTQLPSVAMPDAFVTGVASVIVPSPLRIVNVTVIPGTPTPSASMTRTEGLIGTG